MRISILGAGNEGCALAADLSYKGNKVTLVKTSNSINDKNFEYLLNNNGKIQLIDFDNSKKNTNIYRCTRDISEVFITIQTTYHEQLIKKLSKFLNKDQIVIINPGYLSTAYFLKYSSNSNLTIVEAESSFIDCRIVSEGKVKSFFRNCRNPVGVYPHNKIDFVKNKLDQLGFPLKYVNTVEAALHNPNLILHTSGAIMNITSIEKRKDAFCLYGEGFTNSTLKVLEQLDMEKISILKKIGLKPITYYEACKYRNSLDNESDPKQVFLDYTVIAKNIKGPNTIYSRYITEDVSQGLVMLESLAKYLKIDTPICTSLINISSVCLGIDFRKEGRNINRLGINNIKKIVEDSLK